MIDVKLTWQCDGFKGYMSDVALFNKSLIEEEILKLYEYGKL